MSDTENPKNSTDSNKECEKNAITKNDKPIATATDKVIKVDILLNATGDAPIMKQRRWALDQEKEISWVINYIHKYLKLPPEEKIFLYVNQTFAPSPDQLIKNLYECYGSNGKLVLYYSKSQAWG